MLNLKRHQTQRLKQIQLETQLNVFKTQVCYLRTLVFDKKVPNNAADV